TLAFFARVGTSDLYLLSLNLKLSTLPPTLSQSTRKNGAPHFLMAPARSKAWATHYKRAPFRVSCGCCAEADNHKPKERNTRMNSVRYVGLDVHRDTISVAVLNESGRLIMQSVLATRAAAILDFMGGMRGIVHVTFEEGTHSAWL